MKMAELEQRTGVNRETIRVLIRRGLIPQPKKPNATVAHYSEDHVQAIQAVRQLQQQYRMTLSQIDDVLKGKSFDQRVESTAFTHLEQLVAAGVGMQEQLVPVASLVESNPFATTDAKAFEGLGMVERIETPDGDQVSYSDARMISIWGEMRQAGFDEIGNFPPETLDHYARAAEYLARAEAERFLARTQGRMSDTEAAEMLQFALPRMLDFFGLLRMKLFIRYIKGLDTSDGHEGRSRRPEPPLPAKVSSAGSGSVPPAETAYSPNRATPLSKTLRPATKASKA